MQTFFGGIHFFSPKNWGKLKHKYWWSIIEQITADRPSTVATSCGPVVTRIIYLPVVP